MIILIAGLAVIKEGVATQIKCLHEEEGVAV